MAEAERCLQCGGCSECLECVKACEAKAIDHQMKDEHLEIEVGSIILSPGFDEFQPSLKTEYGYGRFPNVVSSIEFERFLSASGPFKGQVLRPSDDKHPKKVAWIQCVGSRDPHIGKGYCSSVCCMYATKEAVIAKEHAPEMEATIFFMDMRAYGKDFDKYIERAKKDYGVRYIRSRVSHLKEDPKTKISLIHYETEEGEMVSEEFDLVVLSVGLGPAARSPGDRRGLRHRSEPLRVCQDVDLSPSSDLETGDLCQRRLLRTQGCSRDRGTGKCRSGGSLLPSLRVERNAGHRKGIRSGKERELRGPPHRCLHLPLRDQYRRGGRTSLLSWNMPGRCPTSSMRPTTSTPVHRILRTRSRR